jgi:hypothetical protein
VRGREAVLEGAVRAEGPNPAAVLVGIVSAPTAGIRWSMKWESAALISNVLSAARRWRGSDGGLAKVGKVLTEFRRVQ